MRGRLGANLSGVERHAVPGEPLHERHRRVLVEIGFMVLVLLEDGEGAGGGLVAGRPARHGRYADQGRSPPDEGALGAEADEDGDGAFGSFVADPEVTSRSQRRRGGGGVRRASGQSGSGGRGKGRGEDQGLE